MDCIRGFAFIGQTMADYWIKLYHDILDDPKMATMSDNLWRRVIELFLLAGKLYKDGELPDTKQIAWCLRQKENELETELKQIVTTGIIEKTEIGWFIPKFKTRQDPMSGAERTSNFRKKQQSQQYNGNVTELKRNVTQITDNRSDNRSDTDNTEASPNLFVEKNIVEYQRVFEKETGITVYRIDLAGELWDKMQKDGVTPDDLKTGIHEQQHSKHTTYTIVRPQSVANAAYNAMQRRLLNKSPETGSKKKKLLIENGDPVYGEDGKAVFVDVEDAL